MAALKHIHIYARWKKRGGELWFKCNDPLCTHIAPRSLVMGKASLCTKCGSKITQLTWKHLDRIKPLCLGCSDTPEGRSFRAAQDLVSTLLKDPAFDKDLDNMMDQVMFDREDGQI